MNRKGLLLLSFLIIWGFACTQKKESSFAIVVDSESYKEAKQEIDAYAASVVKQGLKSVILVDQWHHPDSIRARLLDLYHSKKAPLEGVVFVGDIPVPMLRDCQHMATAFKMDQDRYAWNRSSVPSDRFYDDFDLQFTYLKHDTINTLYHYYSLNAESPQRLTPDIYSARIKPPKGDNQYVLLRNYLKKVVEFKNNPPKVDQVFFFTGHGYNSEDPRSWMDEKLALSQQFDYLNSQKSFLGYFNFQDEEHIKFRLLSELKRKDLDIALLHHHGGDDAQYLDGMPESVSVEEQIKQVKMYLRSKVGSAKTPEALKAAKANYKKWLDVPDSWFEGAFDEKVIREDSIYSANLDIYIDDHKDYFSNVPFIMIDACFTGSFHLDNYLSAQYLFDEGKTIAAQANSVNILQDKYSDEMVGLLGLGLRIGFWNQMVCTLESHLIGDPTMAFQPFDAKLNLNEWIVANKGNKKFWEKQLTSEYADVQSLALRKLFEIEGKSMSGFLLNTFTESKLFPVRTEALRLLHICKDDNFIKAINLGLTDSYELIQRFSAIYISESGSPEHIPYLIDALLRNNVYKRVAYNLKDAINGFDKKALLEELDKQINNKEFLLNRDESYQDLKKTIEYNCGKMQQYIDEILAPEAKEKEAVFNLRAFRNLPVHQHLNVLFNYLDTLSNNRVKLAGIEMLGWFDHSYERQKISDFCDKELKDETLTVEIRNELIKTKNRVN